MQTTRQSVLLLLLTAVFSFGQPAPRVDDVQPRKAQPGTLITVTGSNLNRPSIDRTFVTDHRLDLQAKIIEQSEAKLVFRVPPFVKPGRLQLLFLTGGNSPSLLEEPFYLEIEEKDPAATVSEPPPPAPARVQVTSTMRPPEPPRQIPAAVAAAAPPAVVAHSAAAAAPAVTPPIPPARPEELLASNPAPDAATDEESRTIKRPRLIRYTEPEYPSSARAFGLAGSVTLMARIDQNGRVTRIRTLEGHPLLVFKAAESVRTWRYEPAEINGKPVQSEAPVVVRFSKESQTGRR